MNHIQETVWHFFWNVWDKPDCCTSCHNSFKTASVSIIVKIHVLCSVNMNIKMLIVFWGGDVEGTMWERKLLLCVLTADMCRPGQRRSGPSCDFTLGGYAVCISAGAHPPPPAHLSSPFFNTLSCLSPLLSVKQPQTVPPLHHMWEAPLRATRHIPPTRRLSFILIVAGGGFTQDMKWDWAQHTFIGLWTHGTGLCSTCSLLLYLPC